MKKRKLEDYSDDQESKFNMALASLKRLHDDFVNCKMCSTNFMLWDAWYLNLRNAFREVSCVLKDEETESCKKKIKDLKKNRNMHVLLIRKSNKHYSENFYESLDDFEIYLRFLANKHDLMFPSKKSILDFADKMERG